MPLLTSRSKLLLAALLTCSALIAGSGAGLAQGGRTFELGRDERAAIAALQAAVASQDRAAQDMALRTAQNTTRGADGRYLVAGLHYQIARSRGDARGMSEAGDAMLATGIPQGAELAALIGNQASRAYSANDLRRADSLLGRVVEAQPNNPVILADHAQLKARLGDRPAAVALFQRAFAAQRTSGRAGPESWHQRALALAVDGRLGPQSVELGRELVFAYPTPANWRDALFTLRSAAQADPALDLDIHRLRRAAAGMAGERDYLEYAAAATRAAAPAETKAVLDEGVSRGMLDANEAVVRQQLTAVTARAAQERAGLAAARTRALAAADGRPALAAGDSFFGAGQYPQAAELYQAALEKGGQDPNLLNIRLGAALALAGQRVESEAALRAVAGPRADLAAYWLIWLARRPA